VIDVYFDTAVFLKLYVQEATSPDALRLASDSPAPQLLMPWQDIEVRTAIRLKAFRKEITAAEMPASLEAFDEDILSGRWKTREYQEATVWRFARDLSGRHAETIACRTLDLLHVAVALSWGVKTFVTFDERQRAVAKLEGLTVKPTNKAIMHGHAGGLRLPPFSERSF
jgi:predicted nucleic acid-binding protein